jgi:hypothetical protein
VSYAADSSVSGAAALKMRCVREFVRRAHSIPAPVSASPPTALGGDAAVVACPVMLWGASVNIAFCRNQGSWSPGRGSRMFLFVLLDKSRQARGRRGRSECLRLARRTTMRWKAFPSLVGAALVVGCGSASHAVRHQTQRQPATASTVTPIESCAQTFRHLYTLSASQGFAGPGVETVMGVFGPSGVALGEARLVVLRQPTSNDPGICSLTFTEGPGYAETMVFVDKYVGFSGSEAPANQPTNGKVTGNATIEGGGVITMSSAIASTTSSTAAAPTSANTTGATSTAAAAPTSTSSTVPLKTGPGSAPSSGVGPATDRNACPGSTADTEDGRGGSCAIAESALSVLKSDYTRTHEIPAHITVSQPPEPVVNLSCDLQNGNSEVDCTRGNVVVVTIEFSSIES